MDLGLKIMVHEPLAGMKVKLGVEMGKKAEGDQPHLGQQGVEQILLADEALGDENLSDHASRRDQTGDGAKDFLGDLPHFVKKSSQALFRDAGLGENEAAVLEIKEFLRARICGVQLTAFPFQGDLFEEECDMVHASRLIVVQRCLP